MRGTSLLTVVIYDIENDLIRKRMSDACKNMGLERVQYSSFRGMLTAAERRTLYTKLGDLLGDKPGRVLVIPLCEKDATDVREINNSSWGSVKSEA